MIRYRDELSLAPRSANRLELGADETQVWPLALAEARVRAESLIGLLAPDERAKAARYHRPEDRDRYTVARGMLRTILAGYLGHDPARLSFTYSSYGKPFLIETQNREGLCFNLSHSHEQALLAVAWRCELGVDIEFMREDLANLEIAERFFSKAEVAVLQSLPAAQQMVAFFNCWTRKEAYIKALGEGLSHPLDRFTVSLEPGRPAALLTAENDPEAPRQWRLDALETSPGYVAALAVKRPRHEL
ncbi:MAG TPA: 4'-phosphopantetheinyl transferase superfamily protein, partial [Blastocatellia bacterium]|nr:4'-phosphopantetheinyl transferase superfamily protein [Blastocatellia bacterium]